MYCVCKREWNTLNPSGTTVPFPWLRILHLQDISHHGIKPDWLEYTSFSTRGAKYILPLTPNTQYIFHRAKCLALPASEVIKFMAFSFLGWGLLNQFLPLYSFHSFSESSKYTLPIEYHLHICQVSPEVAPDKCECDVKKHTGIFARRKRQRI